MHYGIYCRWNVIRLQLKQHKQVSQKKLPKCEKFISCSRWNHTNVKKCHTITRRSFRSYWRKYLILPEQQQRMNKKPLYLSGWAHFYMHRHTYIYWYMSKKKIVTAKNYQIFGKQKFLAHFLFCHTQHDFSNIVYYLIIFP